MIDKRFRGRCKYRIVRTEYPGHASEIARSCEERLVVAVGGDGTVSEVACGLLQASGAGSCHGSGEAQPGTDSGAERTGKVLGIIPCGSGDGLALHLGISRNPSKAIDTLLGGSKIPMDYGTVNGRPFFCTTGTGFDADVAAAFASSRSRGLITYITTALRVWRHFKPLKYSISVDGRLFETDAAIVTVGNASQWGNHALITPEASVCDGMMDVTVVRPFHIWNVPRLALLLMTGKAYKAREVIHLRGRKILIHRPTEGAVHYDGDPCIMGRDITVETFPAALDVISAETR